MVKRKSLTKILLTVLLVGCMISLLACKDKNLKPDYGTEYQAIFTTAGHVMFGKIEKIEPTYVLINDVYVTQSRVDPTTKQTTNFLVSRTHQWHKPSATYLNPANIAMIEPVGADSEAAKMIKEAKDRPPEKK